MDNLSLEMSNVKLALPIFIMIDKHFDNYLDNLDNPSREIILPLICQSKCCNLFNNN
jgi:hypothetical protein